MARKNTTSPRSPSEQPLTPSKDTLPVSACFNHQPAETGSTRSNPISAAHTRAAWDASTPFLQHPSTPSQLILRITSKVPRSGNRRNNHSKGPAPRPTEAKNAAGSPRRRRAPKSPPAPVGLHLLYPHLRAGASHPAPTPRRTPAWRRQTGKWTSRGRPVPPCSPEGDTFPYKQ